MEKTELLNKLFNKKNKDYTYIILFFLIFSFFVFFAIRPNLVSVFSANSQIRKLRVTDDIYEGQINKIIDIQSALEKTRGDLPLINEAVPYFPELNKVVNDLEKLISKNKLNAQKINIANIDLKDVNKNEKLKAIGIETELIGGFEEVHSFLNDLAQQRRLKAITEIRIEADTEAASKAAELKVNLKMESYYL